LRSHIPPPPPPPILWRKGNSVQAAAWSACRSMALAEHAAWLENAPRMLRPYQFNIPIPLLFSILRLQLKMWGSGAQLAQAHVTPSTCTSSTVNSVFWASHSAWEGAHPTLHSPPLPWP
jgi:hypothetical protein